MPGEKKYVFALKKFDLLDTFAYYFNQRNGKRINTDRRRSARIPRVEVGAAPWNTGTELQQPLF